MCRAFRSKTFFFILLIFTLTLCLSCDPEERHKILTTFFDGVPPLYEEVIITDPNEVTLTETTAGVTWYIHEPHKDCTTCHGEKKKGTFAREVRMNIVVPGLCFECHEELQSTPERYVHGPVAIGQCLVCHNPHKTVNKHLLKRAIPEMCFECHEPEWVDTIANHDQEDYMQCLDCHSGHASDQKRLLKDNWDNREPIKETETPSDEGIEAPSGKETESPIDEDIEAALMEKELIEVMDF